MATQDRVIDLERTYIPMDPNSFPETMHATGGEDAPENRIPVICYDGYNFLPTQYGYASFFGVNSTLDIDALDARVDETFIVQTDELVNIIVALTETGIWTKQGSSTGAWNHIITLTAPPSDTHKNWTKAVIENAIVLYRQGEATIWRMTSANDFVPTAATPTFLNMAGQIGIFKAGGRLGFWDSDGSVSWSSVDDLTNFTPDISSGAANTKFQQIYGKIVVIYQHGTGFIIYCTKSIVLVARGADANFFWVSEAVFTGNGISYKDQACVGQPDTVHFVYTTFGFVKIDTGKAEYVLAEVFSYVKEKKLPVYLSVLEGRFLFLGLIDPDLTYPIVNFSTGIVEPVTLTWAQASNAVANPEDDGCQAIAGAQNQEGRWLFDTFGFTATNQANEIGSVPVWEDHLNTVVPLGNLEAWKATGTGGMGDPDYFTNKFTSEGGIPKINGSGTEYFVPSGMLDASSYAFQANMHVEANTGDFYRKQDWLWYAESVMYDHWKTKIAGRSHGSYTQSAGTIATNDLYAFTGDGTVSTMHSFGPYLDLSFQSESNKYYGAADKSIWSQRSLAQLVYIDVDETVDTTAGSVTVSAWNYTGSTNGGPNAPVAGYASYSAIPSAGAMAGILGHSGGGHTYTYTLARTDTAGVVSFSGQLIEDGTPIAPAAIGFAAATGINFGTPRAGEVYIIAGNFVQRFRVQPFRYVSVPICTYKEFGFTQITGHGHYTLLNVFVSDDSTDESVDYVDQCSPVPAKRKPPVFNGVQLPSTPGFSCGAVDVTIDGSVTYSYPEQSITLPEGSFLLQDGSIEPIYPTFSGAYVFDLQYKKWGKMGQEYKTLLDYSPINSEAGDRRITPDIFGIFSGCLLPSGEVALFDKYPTESVMRFGKIGYYRHGFTDCEGVDLQFRNPATGTVTLEGSIDGKNITAETVLLESFENVNQVSTGFTASARWFNIVIQGIFDLKHLEFKGRRKGRR